jgi:Flp pilus assembly protein TadG
MKKLTLLAALAASPYLIAGAVIGGNGDYTSAVKNATNTSTSSTLTPAPSAQYVAERSGYVEDGHERAKNIRELQQAFNARGGAPYRNTTATFSATFEVGGGKTHTTNPVPPPTTVHGMFSHGDGANSAVTSPVLRAGLEEMARKAGGTLETVSGTGTAYIRSNGSRYRPVTVTLQSYIIKDIKKTIDWKVCSGSSDTPGTCSDLITLTPANSNSYTFAPYIRGKSGTDINGWRIATKQSTVRISEYVVHRTQRDQRPTVRTHTNVYASSSTVTLLSKKNIISGVLFDGGTLSGITKGYRYNNRHDHYWIK